MDYTLRRSDRAKKMSLRLNESGELTLVLPRFVPEMAGRAFVSANKHWINQQRAQLLPVQTYHTLLLVSGSVLTFFDQKFYTIKIASSSLKRDYYKQTAKEIIFFLRPVSTKSLTSRDRSLTKQARVKTLIEKFYREQARNYLTERSTFFAEQLGTSFNDLRIKNTKSRWGSCSSKKNLNYNWRIMMAPKSVIDYLVIHEVCHLKQMNHSSKFWGLVESLDPNFRVHKQWLKQNQGRLFSFLN